MDEVFAYSSAKKSILDIPKYAPTACDFLDAVDDDVTKKNCCVDKMKHDANTSELFCVNVYPVNYILKDSDVKLKSFSVHSITQRDSVSGLENMVIIS